MPLSLRRAKYSKVTRWLMAAACAILLQAGALAETSSTDKGEDSSESIFSFRGYGTAGLAHSTEKNADFLAHDLQRRGAGRNANWSAEVDSRIGAQLDIRPTADLFAVIQVTSEQRYDGTYNPEIEWANIKYQITPDLSARAGRIVMPTFLHSDSRKVGYSMPWVRPPVEVYSLLPLTRLDGIDSSWHQSFGGFSNTIQLLYGQSKVHTTDGGEVKGEEGRGIADTLEHGDATLHFTYIRTRGTITSYDRLFNGYRQLAAAVPPLAPQVSALIDRYEPDEKAFNVFTIGASYNPGKWFVMGEYGYVNTHSIYGKRSGWYLSSGHRIGAFTPYVTYAEAHLDSNSSDPGVAHAAASSLNAALNEELSAAQEQKTLSFGVRWDCAKNVALKMQYDRTNIESGSPGTLDHQNGTFQEGGKFRVYSVVLDFLF